MHHVGRLDPSSMSTPEAYRGRSAGYARQPLIDRLAGSVHMGFGACQLAPEGHITGHVHSYEEAFYVLEGHPRLSMGGETVELAPHQCGLIPVGVAHAWRNGGTQSCRWLDMLAPSPRDPGQEPPDTFFTPEPEPGNGSRLLDVRDPRCRHFFRLDDGQMDVDRLKRGSAVGEPTVSASMATALLAYSGIAVKMLVDQRLGAHLLTMFMVEYQPGGVAHPHDHPFEESYVMLEGEVDVVADGDRHTLRPGDVFWTGVSCVHAFYETRGGTVKWLETSAPGPPDRHAYRFERDWAYLAEKLDGGGA
jgi:quercetin dioxygenase-like cupin family protein